MREDAFRRGFARTLKGVRAARGLTQRELAEAAEIAEKYLSRLELAMATPSLHVAVRLARALGVGVEDLTAFAPGGRASAVDYGSVVRLLRGRSAREIDRVLRVAREVLR